MYNTCFEQKILMDLQFRPHYYNAQHKLNKSSEVNPEKKNNMEWF